MVTLYVAIILVHLLCPARTVPGYACAPQDVWQVTSSKGAPKQHQERLQPLQYSLNGFRCFWIIVGGFLALQYYNHSNDNQDAVASLVLTHNFWKCAMVSNGLGLLASYYFVYVRYPELPAVAQKANKLRRAPTSSVAIGHPLLQQPLAWDDRGIPFFHGREFNPRWTISVLGTTKIVDVKMLLYLIGAIVLELNVLSTVYYEQVLRRHYNTSETANINANSDAILLYAGLFTWFILDYLWYEQVHLYTYDLFAEKMGFKLSWGCLCFYPFFYAIGALSFVMMDPAFYKRQTQQNENLSTTSMLLISCVYILGSTLTRGANMQKFQFRCRRPEQQPASTVSLFGGLLLVKQACVPSSEGRILCSGFWGLSRHVNYLGEILQAVALALPPWLYLIVPEVDETTTGQWVRWIPWLYPLYYIALFLPRQIDDEHLMRQKYGNDVMEEYIQMVPYRMVPGLY